MINLENVSKSFVLHQQNSAHLQALVNVNLQVNAGQCTVLDGPSGMGKSTLLKMIYGNYKCDAGSIKITGHDQTVTDVCTASPRELIELRANTVGYVSQFLRVIPRVSALQIVAEPLEQLLEAHAAAVKAQEMLNCLNVPEHLWKLPPSTFSGGEQQRINIARGFIRFKAVLLLDEPTASLDAKNANVVIDLIEQAKAKGATMIGIFHDQRIREQVASHIIAMQQFSH